MQASTFFGKMVKFVASIMVNRRTLILEQNLP
jgi:hypothetical protein